MTIAVDSYGPVTDNAQSVYELSMIEDIPGIDGELSRDFGFTPQWDTAKQMLEENDGAGNTFKATAKPVLIGTAVVGSTTMIFSIIMLLTEGLTTGMENLSLLYPPFLLGLISGGAIIYWFTGASIQAVTTGAYRAVEFIKGTIKLDGVTKASEADSRRVVEICTQYAQQGMINMFLGVFFATLAFAFVEPYLFIGYLVSIAAFGLYQALFMANAGGAWDNAKKIVEIDLHAKGTALHDATIVGDTVGDPYKDTSSVALNPVIKFTTLFGLLAVELAVSLENQGRHALVLVLAAAFFAVSVYFVHRSFYGMRIEVPLVDDEEYPEEPDGSGGFGGSGSLPEGSSAIGVRGSRWGQVNIAIRYGAAIVDADGHVSGHDAGATLVRRLLRVFPEARLIGPGPRQGEGFDVIPLEFVDGSDTVVINMDVIDSVGVWQTLKENCDEPKLMNFVWFNTAKYDHRVQRSALGLSCGLFPTFANSERTANEIREIVSGWTIKSIWEEARIAWVNLGHPARARPAAPGDDRPGRAVPGHLPLGAQAAAAVPRHRREDPEAHPDQGRGPPARVAPDQRARHAPVAQGLGVGRSADRDP